VELKSLETALNIFINTIIFKINFSFNPEMAKCDLCGEKIAELFLGKLKGTILKKEGSSKQYTICFACQKKFPTKAELLKQLK